MDSLTGYATVDCLNCDFCNYRISVIVGSCGLQGVLYGITYEQPQGVKPQRLKAIHPSHTENRGGSSGSAVKRRCELRSARTVKHCGRSRGATHEDSNT